MFIFIFTSVVNLPLWKLLLAYSNWYKSRYSVLFIYFFVQKKSHWMLPFLIRCVVALLSFILAGFMFLVSALFAESAGSLILDKVKMNESYVKNNKTQVEEAEATTETVMQKSSTILNEDFVDNITGYTRGLSIFMLLVSCLAFGIYIFFTLKFGSYKYITYVYRDWFTLDLIEMQFSWACTEIPELQDTGHCLNLVLLLFVITIQLCIG